MFESLAAVGLFAGFVLVVRLIAGPGTHDTVLTGLFTTAPMPARPRGVQETDLAPFHFSDAQPVATSTVQIRDIDDREETARAA